MQRRATKQSPPPPAGAKDLVSWIKERGICAACGDDGGVIAHHVAGSSAKTRAGIERVYIGPWFVNGLCQNCDDIVTHQSRGEFRMWFGAESEVWLNQIDDYEGEIPEIVVEAVRQWGK